MSASTRSRRRGMLLEARLAGKVVARTTRSTDSSEDEYMPRVSTRRRKEISYEESSDEEDDLSLRYVERQDIIVISDSDSEVEHVTPKPIRTKKNGAQNATTKSIRAKKTPVQNATGAGKIFVNFAIEIHQLIASHFEDDKDICTYRLICKQSEICITASFWRIRFNQHYDFAEHLDVNGLAEEYKFRKRTSNLWTCFDLGKFGGHVDREIRQIQAKQQRDCLLMLQSLILQSNAQQIQDEKGRKIVQGKNLEFITDLLTGQNGKSYVDIIDAIFNTDKDRYLNKPTDMSMIVSATSRDTLLYVIQICLASFAFHPNMSTTKASHFDISQYQVYSLADSQPLFAGKWKQDINVRLLLHLVNFFKYHLKAEGEGLLAHCYKQLELDQVPQPWVGRIKAGVQPLASHWKGAHTYMDPETLKSLRLWDGSSSWVHADSLDGNETFQDISLFFGETQYPINKWPKEWEHILCSDAFKDLNDKQPQGARGTRRTNSKEAMKPEIKQFWGSCRGARKGHFFGRIHSMTTQRDIHGFQRIVLMKFYTREVNGVDVYDPTQIWAYEGCVFPGGRLIVGRWWDAVNDPRSITCASGPFIWWNVEESTAVQPIKPDEAWQFLDSFHEPSLGVSF